MSSKKSTRVSRNVKPYEVNPDWIRKCVESVDERKIFAKMHIINAEVSIKCKECSNSRMTPFFKSMYFNSFCSVEIFSSSGVIISDQTPTVLNTWTPRFNTVFKFGDAKEQALAGNETLSISIYYWDAKRPSIKIGTTKIAVQKLLLHPDGQAVFEDHFLTIPKDLVEEYQLESIQVKLHFSVKAMKFKPGLAES